MSTPNSETQDQINARLTAGVAANTASIVSENLRATGAEARIKMCVKYMGSKETVAELPATGNVQGDFWYVSATRHGYFWNANLATPAWDDVGEITKGVDGEDGSDGEDGEDGEDGVSASASVVKSSVDASGNKTTTITCQTGSTTPTTATINCPDIKIVASSASATEAGTIYFVTGS